MIARIAILMAVTLVAGGALAAPLGPYTPIVTESDILPVTVKADYDVGATCVGPTGVIYTIDLDGTDSYLRITPGSPNTVELMATQVSIEAAIEAVNGTTTITAFNGRAIDVAADGSIVVVGFTAGFTNGDTLISMTDTAPATITVVHTAVNGVDSALDGSDSLTVLGNTAYVGLNDANGASDSVVSLDTNAAGPSATVTTLLNEDTTEALIGAPEGSAGINALANDGTDLFGIASDAATSRDTVLRITTAGVASIYVSAEDIIADLNAQAPPVTDVGYGGLAVDASGEIWLANSFGVAGQAFTNSIIQATNVTPPTGATIGTTASALETALGLPLASGPFINNDSLDYDALNDRVIFAEGDSETIVSVPASPPVFTAALDWALYR